MPTAAKTTKATKTATAKTVNKAAAKTVKNEIVKTAAKSAKIAPKPVTKPAAVSKPVAAKPAAKAEALTAPKNAIKVKNTLAGNDNSDFGAGDYVVYPAHGVGQIDGIEHTTIGGMKVSLYAITFEKDRMRLKIPVIKAKTSGLRKLSSSNRLKDAMKTLQGRARIRRTMWSRRAQEYELKINSGDPVAIAEVLRDLKRSTDDTEQSYSERQIYQSALQRLAREVAAVQAITEIQASEKLEVILGKVAAAPAVAAEADVA
ncbi:MAG: CarD-like transcriptional regulator [Micavibrio sp.]|nr:CarD-like transcriptional regulator [Micavibrio sp.]